MITDAIIRAVRDSDIPQIVEIYNYYVLNTTASFEVKALGLEQMRDRINTFVKYAPCLVASNNNGVVMGYCYMHPWKERAAYGHVFETTIYLHTNYVGRGIGLELMRHFIAGLKPKSEDVPTILIACITEENVASIRMHRKLGFREVSRFENVGFKFGRFLNVVDMEYAIGNPILSL